MSNWPLKVAIAVAILSVHVAVLARIFWIESTAVSSNLATPETAFATAEILQSQDVRDKVPAPGSTAPDSDALGDGATRNRVRRFYRR